MHTQLQEMANAGIIQPSNSPWCAPAVYVPKANGEVRICVDFIQLNKITKKDSYPVPRADGPQQKLANKKVFSKIDLKSAYWQFPMHKDSIKKTAFSPGPGYGLWEFTVMPYGLTGATQTCQRGLDEVLRDCKDCVDNYVDDCIIFSDSMSSHITDLSRVLGKLAAAGFTLRGSKCFFGKTSVSHLGFEYSNDGVSPMIEKTKAIQEWPTPRCPKDVRSFLGLANFYCRFVPRFADIAAPLTDLTGNNVVFNWEEKHEKAFKALKHLLSSPPVIVYPKSSDTFTLATDASDVGLGAVLSTANGAVVEYASRILTKAEKSYATIEKECLAIVWATRKFRHYLIGAPFIIQTDHKPLEWLESSKSSKARSQRLERWSLELRAYDFHIVHRPGITNQHADALSRRPIALVALSPPLEAAEIAKAQRADPVLSTVIELLEQGTSPPKSKEWLKFPLKRYKQLWPQLTIHQAILCRKIKSPAMTDSQLLIVVPSSLHKLFLQLAHDDSGHQGVDRTMSKLSSMAYWIGMGRRVADHCKFCVKCQYCKSPAPKPAPLQPVLATRPWEMVAVDILKVPVSTNGNRYLLVAQDYFSKWPFAMAMPDQTAERIVKVLRDEVFTFVGPPQKLHSDQGRNFESRILADLCKAFGVKKSHTTPYHPMGDGLVERMNRSLLTLLRTHVEKDSQWEEHLQLLLFMYRTTKHASTGLSPYEILFGSNPPSHWLPNLQESVVVDQVDYVENLKRILLQLKEILDANSIEAANEQKHSYRSSDVHSQLSQGQQVLLSNEVAGKLDPRWTGPWTVIEMKGPTTVVLRMGTAERTVHINIVRPLLMKDTQNPVAEQDWIPPLFIHDNAVDQPHPRCADPEPERPPSVLIHHQSNGSHPVITTRSGRVVRPVQRFGRTED